MPAKLRLRILFILFLCLINIFSTRAQSVDFVNGRVVNAITLEPVPFASVWLKNHQLGVYANAEGDFKIILNPGFREDSLIVSCIGFKRNSVYIGDLSDLSVNTLYLAPNVHEFKEIKITANRKKLNSYIVVAKALRKIRENYPDNPYSFISYYRDYQKQDGNYLNLNEAIVQTIDRGFSSKSITNEYRLIDFKKNMDFPRMNISPYYDTVLPSNSNFSNKIIPKAKVGDQFGNELFVLMVHDAVRNYQTNSFSFINTFSRDFLTNHDFAKPNRVYNNDLLLLKIDFNGKSRITGDSLRVNGSIYIQPEDYSIHKLSYSCSFLITAQEEKEIYNIDIEYGHENAVDSLMCLKYISFKNAFNIVDRDDSTYFKLLDTYWRLDEFSSSTLVLEFNKVVDPESAVRKENYEIKLGAKKGKILDIVVRNKFLYIKLNNMNIREFRDSAFVQVRNLKDVDGNILNKRKIIEFNQYRELFVQDYNKLLLFEDNCYLQQIPLEQNCISENSGKDIYWMNTPEKIMKEK